MKPLRIYDANVITNSLTEDIPHTHVTRWDRVYMIWDVDRRIEELTKEIERLKKQLEASHE